MIFHLAPRGDCRGRKAAVPDWMTILPLRLTTTIEGGRRRGEIVLHVLRQFHLAPCHGCGIVTKRRAERWSKLFTGFTAETALKLSCAMVQALRRLGERSTEKPPGSARDDLRVATSRRRLGHHIPPAVAAIDSSRVTEESRNSVVISRGPGVGGQRHSGYQDAVRYAGP